MPLLKRILTRLDRVRHPEAKLSFAQEAEDLVLLRHLRLPTHRVPFYVDVGAHDPKWLSNTCLLYRSGWQGINIDATPRVAEKFRKHRPRDVSIEAAIGAGDSLEFVDFEGHATSGFTNETLSARSAAGLAIRGRRIIETIRLSQVLEKHLRPSQAIDLLSIDVEGHELQVLASNDWQRFRPGVILVEIGDAMSLNDVLSAPAYDFLSARGYIAFAKTGLTVFFADKQKLVTDEMGYHIKL